MCGKLTQSIKPQWERSRSAATFLTIATRRNNDSLTFLLAEFPPRRSTTKGVVDLTANRVRRDSPSFPSRAPDRLTNLLFPCLIPRRSGTLRGARTPAIVKNSRRVVNFHGSRAGVEAPPPRVKMRDPSLRDTREISIVHYGKWETRPVAVELLIQSDRYPRAQARIVGFLVQSAVIGVPTARTYMLARSPARDRTEFARAYTPYSFRVFDRRVTRISESVNLLPFVYAARCPSCQRKTVSAADSSSITVQRAIAGLSPIFISHFRLLPKRHSRIVGQESSDVRGPRDRALLPRNRPSCNA